MKTHIYKTVTLFFAFMIGIWMARAQSSTQIIYGKKVAESTFNGSQYNTTETYFDGLGRPRKTIQPKASPGKFNNSSIPKDLITFSQYDCMGRDDSVSYLPYAGSGGAPSVLDKNALQTFYSGYTTPINDAKYAYSTKEYDTSPLNVVKESSSPGQYHNTNSSLGHPLKLINRLNQNSDSIKVYTIKNDSVLCFTKWSPADILTVEEEEADQSPGVTISKCTYKNHQGQIVASSICSKGEIPRYTYYVYDEYFDLLRCVIPPVVDNQIKTQGSEYVWHQFKEHLRWLEYNKRGDVAREFYPGKDYTCYVYDKMHHLILSQDGNQRSENRWIYTVYDQFYRPVRQNLIERALVAYDKIQWYFDEVVDFTYPTASNLWKLDVPLNDGYFKLVTNLSETRYGGFNYLDSQNDNVAEIPEYLAYESAYTPDKPAGNVIISEIMYDTPLNEQIATGAAYSNGEYIELYNASTEPVDLGGWQLKGGGTTETFEFPAKTYIYTGGTFIIAYQYNNSGFTLEQLYSNLQNSNQILYQRKIILSNSGETISLIDKNGNIVDAVFYDGTSNKSKPDRLSAANRDGIVGTECVSLHRVRAHYDTNNLAIASNADWITTYITPKSVPNSAGLSGPKVMPNRDFFDATGLKIYEKSAVLGNDDSFEEYVERAFYYNKDGDVIQTVEKSPSGGISRYSNWYDYTGNLMVSHETHSNTPEWACNICSEHMPSLYEPSICNSCNSQKGLFILSSPPPPVIREWECQACGYVHEGKTAPDRCPMCDSPASEFTSTPDPTPEWLCSHCDNITFSDNRPDVFSNCNTYECSFVHVLSAESDTKLSKFTYDDFDRLLSEEVTINNSEPTVVKYKYDDLGLCSEVVYGAAVLCDKYTYDIAGAQTSQDNEIYNMRLYKERPLNAATKPSFNGMITEKSWILKDSTELQKVYSYSYTPYGEFKGVSLRSGGDLVDGYLEKDLQYDLNGNILTLRRTGADGSLTADYEYDYNGNQLTSLTNGEAPVRTFLYDSNGNMNFDSRNSWNYHYNCLNLLTKVADADSSELVRYDYLADGTKIAAVRADSTGLIYRGSLIYRKSPDGLTLESTDFAGGRLIKTSAGYETRYFLRDYLGSVKAVVDSNGSLLEFNNYYPYGSVWEGDYPKTDNRYLYNGKESQEVFGLGWLDYGSRMYDSDLGRWVTPDPLHQFLSDYLYCGNNPVNAVDPDGKYAIVAIPPLLIVTMVATAAIIATQQVNGTNDISLNDIRDGIRDGIREMFSKETSPEYDHQRKTDREAKEGLDKAQAELQESINNNFGPPDPDGSKRPNKDVKAGPVEKVVAGATIGGIVTQAVSDTNLNEKPDDGAPSLKPKATQPEKPAEPSKLIKPDDKIKYIPSWENK